jgi:hypothetical protein
MHSGVQRLVRWVEAQRDQLELNAPATSAELSELEQALAMPLPEDLRQVLTRFNGGTLPSGQLLLAGTGPGTIEAAMRQLAGANDVDFLDPEILLPFCRTLEGSLLCFDRSAGPVADTWPIVDYYEDTGETRLVYRTFDGWCRTCVSEWEAPDFEEEFSLEKYLRQGERHAALEPDVPTAHATVAHAYRRAGEPDRALASYVRASRCVPPLPWCDWEALKLAVLLGRNKEAIEAAIRLSSRAPQTRWAERETTPGRVADVVGQLAAQVHDAGPLTRILDQLEEQAGDEDERAHVHSVRKAVAHGGPLPPSGSPRPTVVPPRDDHDAWWQELRRAYSEGVLRDDDLLLDASLAPLRAKYDFGEILRIRREF